MTGEPKFAPFKFSKTGKNDHCKTMASSNKKNIWNRKKRKIKSEDEIPKDNILMDDEKRMMEMIPRIQHRMGVSREEARNIIRKLDLL